MKSLIAGAIAILSATTFAHATGILEAPITITPDLEQFVVQGPDGALYLEIDDMLIPVGNGEKSALWGTTWTNGIVYYHFDAATIDASDGGPLSGDGAGRRAAWRAAAMEWEATVPGLTFVEGTGAGNYIKVYSSTGNSSAVGMAGGPQTMNIYNWNWRFIIAHEIGHALGLMHEQSRNDRDTFIIVNFGNIQDAMEYNYSIFAGTTDYGVYDYSSVMHYSRCSFWDPAAGSCGTNGYTMNATAAGAAAAGMTTSEAEGAMGNRSDLSAGDIAGVRSLYPGGNGLVFSSCFDNGRTNAWSTATGESVSCAHDVCDSGVALNEECDPCVATVCASDPFCCSTEWDNQCISEAISWCPYSCP